MQRKPKARHALTILLVDDESGVRRVLSRVLARHGHQVLEAGDLTEALSQAERGGIDVAVVDVRIPGNGLELARRLESEFGLRGHVVLMTGGPQTRPEETGMAAPVLAKPFDYDEMLRIVERLAG